MDYQETMSRLNEMKSRFDDGFSSSDRVLLDNLHRFLFNKGIVRTGCSDCYRDAYLLIYNRLKQTNEMPKPKSNYTLKAGAIIRRVGDNRFYANPLPNDEIPENYLADFPGEIIKFESFPPDWQLRVAQRRDGHLPEGEISQEDARARIEALEAELAEKDSLIAEKDSVITSLNVRVEELESTQASESTDTLEELGNLKLENEALIADIQSANNRIAELEEENASLKAKKTRSTKKTEETATEA